MHWLVLLISAVLEAVWATALGDSDGFTRPVPVAIFLVGVTLSMLGLGYAMRDIPIGTAYAVWTGTGAALTVTYAMATGAEPVTFLRILFIAGIVGAVIGLKLVKPKPVEAPRSPAVSDSAEDLG
ncbi:QacE family quaternary ammonium compound efflux SMR transporter [Microbacterium sorbitolivorans]|uniref:QacE family quaternary ammonium compound efflux SMR transporter n=1 Tax=Microbacterium sorbitolivorans TaxID=1867410 RepID=A0A367Y032_9MICO|nr:multidrug efflux SMR transporter [Microbacterium sorbitolivorans]RCK58391.1 QacE family quaternary ammonium compound efflux SMR transporter [Microbacterium sorbitolivorans]GGF36113.1 QacE family quaternary ammonium compound efflux SMR transporter [Microbacterium sorbitolivorans]